MAGKFVLSKDKRGEFRFKLVAGNGQTVAVSQGYSTKSAALNGIDSVRTNAAGADVEDHSEEAAEAHARH
jgi:uncharacterized protein YegP (UPF0339 family)